MIPSINNDHAPILELGLKITMVQESINRGHMIAYKQSRDLVTHPAIEHGDKMALNLRLSFRTRKPPTKFSSEPQLEKNKRTPESFSDLTSDQVRGRRYRKKLKQDEEKYEKYKSSERERSKKRRADRKLNQSNEQKLKEKEQSRVRQQQFRDRLKQQGKKQPQKKRPTTRKSIEELRAYNRAAQAKSRRKRNPQKKRRVKEYDRKRHVLPAENVPSASQTLDEDTVDSFKTPSGKRQALSRARRATPCHPLKYAETIQGLIHSASPRKRKALDKIGLLGPSPKRVKLMQATFNAVKRSMCRFKQSRLGQSQKLRKTFVRTLLESYDDNSLAQKSLGVKSAFLRKCSNGEPRQRRDKLPGSMIQKVKDYYLRPDVSITLPDSKKVKKGESRHILINTLKKTFHNFKGDYPDVKIGKSKFAALRPKNVKPQCNYALNQCLCEYCANVDLKLRAIKRVCCLKKKNGIRTKLSNKYDLVAATLCEKDFGEKYNSRCCLERKCGSCGVNDLKHLLRPLRSKEMVLWQRWENVEEENGKTHKGLVTVKKTVADLIDELVIESEMMPMHLFNAAWEHSQFVAIKDDLPKDTVLMVLDFGQNYACFYQDEAQTAHWYHNQVTVHPIVVYFKDKENITNKEELVFLSSDVEHDAAAVDHFTRLSLEYLRKERNVAIKDVIEFSDGCGAQYKSAKPFLHVAESRSRYSVPITRCFFGSRHGKGPCDGATGVVKSHVRNAVRARRAIVSNAKEMYEYCVDNMTRDTGTDKRHFFLVDKIAREKKKTSNKTVKGTRKLHCVQEGGSGTLLRTRNLACFCTPCRLNDSPSCVNSAYVDPFVLVDLTTGNPVKSKMPAPKSNVCKRTHTKKPLTKSRGRVPRYTGNREMDVAESYKFLMKQDNIEMFKTAAKEIMTVLGQYPFKANPSSATVLSTQQPVDSFALTLVPDDHQSSKCYPICTYGDGNCLARTGSIFVFNNEDHWKEIRVRIAVEMAMNPDVCVDLTELGRGTDFTDDQVNELKVQMVLGSNEVLPPGDMSRDETIRSVYSSATMNSVKSGNYLSMWEMMALSNVMGCPVKSVFPTKRKGPVRDFLNRMIIPRVISTADVATILWTRCSPCTAGIWTPNHFVPLLTMAGDVTCEVIEQPNASDAETEDIEKLIQTCEQIINPNELDIETTGDVGETVQILESSDNLDMKATVVLGETMQTGQQIIEPSTNLDMETIGDVHVGEIIQSCEQASVSTRPSIHTAATIEQDYSIIPEWEQTDSTDDILVQDCDFLLSTSFDGELHTAYVQSLAEIPGTSKSNGLDDATATCTMDSSPSSLHAATGDLTDAMESNIADTERKPEQKEDSLSQLDELRSCATSSVSENCSPESSHDYGSSKSQPSVDVSNGSPGTGGEISTKSHRMVDAQNKSPEKYKERNCETKNKMAKLKPGCYVLVQVPKVSGGSQPYVAEVVRMEEDSVLVSFMERETPVNPQKWRWPDEKLLREYKIYSEAEYDLLKEPSVKIVGSRISYCFQDIPKTGL